MKKDNNIHLVYNPSAGTGDENAKEEIIATIEAHGHRCLYSSSKKKVLKGIEPQTDLIAIAGGDGTIRAVILKLLNKKLKYKRPIAILPCGTANNIANSLGISEHVSQNVACWSNYQLTKFDVGQVLNLDNTKFFIESFGFGIFARLMTCMKKKKTNHINSPEEEFKMALDELILQSKNYKAVSLRMKINNKIVEEDCILLEIMNSSSLGPRLKLSHNADPGDGYFDVILVSEAQRTLLEKYLMDIRANRETIFPIKPIRVKSLEVTWNGNDLHVDDELIKNYKMNALNISVLEGMLEMVVQK